MGKVLTGASVSLDGYIAGPNESGFEHLFAWMGAGENEFRSTHPEIQFRLTAPDFDYLKSYVDGAGVLVVGRHLFDITDGWGGIHPLDRPIVVVTHSLPDAWVSAHPDAPFTFVTDGVASAIERARQIAGDKNIGVAAGTIARQCLELGLVDEVWFDLVPVILGGGTSYFDGLTTDPILLEGPEIIEGTRVTHLRYIVQRQ
jgi:dihydrofolate reductase